MAAGFGGGVPGWMAFKPQLLIHPTYDVVSQNYQRYRIPRPPEQDEAGSTPGQICWGTVGAMPTAEPAPTVDFNVNNEKSRKTQDVRIENPTDSSQYVIADRPTQITFDAKQNAAPPGPNTSSKTPTGLAAFPGDASFKPAGSAATVNPKTVTFNYASTPPP